jgi:hypothetical protein
LKKKNKTLEISEGLHSLSCLPLCFTCWLLKDNTLFDSSFYIGFHFLHFFATNKSYFCFQVYVAS